MDRRLVEDEDRRRLGDGHGQQHELALAERQLACVAAEQVADADAFDRRRDRGPVGRRAAADRVLVGQPAERDDLLDARRERQRRRLRARRPSVARCASRSSRSSGVAVERSTVPAVGSTSPVMARSSVDLPAPFGPIERDPLARPRCRGRRRERRSAAVRDGRRSARTARSQLVPGPRSAEEGRGRTAHR